MTGTKAFDLKDALVTRFKADTTIGAMTPPVDITYGFEGHVDELPRYAVQVGEIQWDSEDDVTLGNHRRDERFYIVLVLHSHVPGDTQPEANARIESLMQAVEASIRDPRWSGIANVISSGFVPQYLAEGADAEGRGAILLSRIYVAARI